MRINYKKCLILALLLLSCVLLTGCSKKDETENNAISSKAYENLDYEYDEGSGEYTLYNDDGTVRATVESEGELQIYVDNPDYDPRLPNNE
jgi:major membrane immunogen (membrane-anchored lipoprotein)